MPRRPDRPGHPATPSRELEQLLADFVVHRRATVSRAVAERDAGTVEALLRHARELARHAADAFDPDIAGAEPGDLTRADVNVVVRCVVVLLEELSRCNPDDPRPIDDAEVGLRQLGRWIARHRACGRQSRVLAMLLERCPAPFPYQPTAPPPFPSGAGAPPPALPFPAPPDPPLPPSFPRLVPGLLPTPPRLPVRAYPRPSGGGDPTAASGAAKPKKPRPRHLHIVR